MHEFKIGDEVYSKEYGVCGRIKFIVRNKCTFETDKPVMGSTVKIVSLSLLVPVKEYEARKMK